ncbi:MAG TPA: prepilin-type N-terminal cleavage/methylation domain-containing protein [Candidatus Binatia bacterium]|nr:prepilin-type N-terminal cleavage/methylation domain-containing protein [Candidatus Binatia bacterium]
MKRVIRDTRGFTLAELLVVCAILGFMMGAIFTLQRQGQLAYLTGAARVEVQQNARLALDTMISDLRSAQLVTVGSTTKVITAIDANCATGTPPTGGGGISISFKDQNGTTVDYIVAAAGTGDCTTASAPCLLRNNVTVIGGVQSLQIWCYNDATPVALDATLEKIRELRIQISTKTERGAQTGSAGDQHAKVEGRVRLRNI